jgi:TonB family protein
MFLNFEDSRPDTPTIERAISLREGVMISVFAHVLLLGLIIYVPRIPFVQAALQRVAEAQQARQLQVEELQRQRERENARFVFVQPRLDTPAPKPPPRAELSDQDRQARTLQKAPTPTNPLPYSRGNTSERVEAAEVQREARAPQPAQAPPQGPQYQGQAHQPSQQQPVTQSAANNTNGFAFDRGTPGAAPRTDAGPAGTAPRPQAGSGSLGEALRNLQRYVQNQNFDNPGGGGGQFGPAIQFDTKGVEFGPWIRRFVAQIRRNWFIPYAAMSMRGHVVLTFNVHKDGRITDLAVVAPSETEAFNNSAYNALLGSNPTQPLPPEYPSDRAFFTVTFYFNEQPPQ